MGSRCKLVSHFVLYLYRNKKLTLELVGETNGTGDNWNANLG